MKLRLGWRLAQPFMEWGRIAYLSRTGSAVSYKCVWPHLNPLPLSASDSKKRERWGALCIPSRAASIRAAVYPIIALNCALSNGRSNPRTFSCPMVVESPE